MPRAVRLAALLAFLFHGGLILATRYRVSYDAYVHMFFADHYRTDWWSLWDERWYTGFFVTSYPPLVHQLIGLLSHIIGLDAAFALILWITVTLLPLAVYSFTRVFLGKSSAGYASIGAAFLPSVYLAAHIFGQLPFLLGTLLALFGAASLARYLKEGGLHNFVLTVTLATTTMASHHAVLLVQPFLIFAVVMKFFLNHRGTKTRRFNIFSGYGHPWLIPRLILFIICAIGLSILVIFPFWDWGRSQTMQTPIDHASRHNFFNDPLASVLFFLPMYGPLVLIIPFALSIARKRQLMGLGIAFLILFLLGLGGTTPLPRLLFGKGWEWLTYDRFAFWASLTLLPFLGIIVTLLRRRYAKDIAIKIYSILAATSLVVGLVTVFLQLQPGGVDMSQVVNFLERADHSRWRYLTFGFGDQLAFLSTLTTATTIDGSYHTARTLPELRSSGIAQIDTAFWFPNGPSALDPILQKASELGVRWGFVNIPQYIPILEKNGWTKLTTLQGGVQVWENPNAILPEPLQTPPVSPFSSFAWGTFPLLSLITTFSLASLRLYLLQAEKVLRGVHAFVVSLIPIALCFWYYKTISQFSHARVYFTYDHALFFVSDALVLLAVILWICRRVAQPTQLIITNFFSSFPVISLSLLLLLSTLSTFWSTDWHTSLYISLHLWLVFLLILSLREWSASWKPAMLGLCAALSIQIITGFTGFALQSTSFLGSLNMRWPGLLDPSMRGASVVEVQNGFRVLRAYGTLPHPNILAGLGLVTLLGPVSFFLTNKKPNYAALVLFVLGVMLIAVTFSRSAWLGLIAFLLVLLLKLRNIDRSRLLLLLATSALTIILALYPLRDLVFTRISNAPVQTEQLSTFGRSWLNEQAMNMLREQPLIGVGVGSFILELADYAVQGAIIEPVHNIVLLIGAELGVLGLIIVASLFVAIAWKITKVQRPQAILASATLTGLGVISFFDHYLWTIAPGRLMFGLVLGLWLGQVACDEA
jgi:O-antigen ligase